jgi:hypothetical protein
MDRAVRAFMVVIVAFVLVGPCTAYCADKVSQSAKNNKWIKSLRVAISALESQQAIEIIDAVEKRLVIGKFNPKLKKIEALEKKKIANPIFLVSINKEEKKNPFWKGILFASSVQFIPSMRAIAIDEGVDFSEEGMATMLAREYWVAYCIVKGRHDGDTEWNAYAFLIRCMVSLGGEGYISLIYDEANKLSKEVEANTEGSQKHLLVEPKKYDERLSFVLWEPASDEEALFMQRCFWIHTIFIMIENDAVSGYVGKQKAEFIKSIDHNSNVRRPIGKLPDKDYHRLYLK